MSYAVEAISAGKKRGIIKQFNTRQEAIRFARTQITKNRGVSVDKLTNSGQRTILQQGMQKTGFDKKFSKDFGPKLSPINQVRRPSPPNSPFSFGNNMFGSQRRRGRYNNSSGFF